MDLQLDIHHGSKKLHYYSIKGVLIDLYKFFYFLCVCMIIQIIETYGKGPHLWI